MVVGGKGVVQGTSYVPSGILSSVILLILVGAGAAFHVKTCDLASTVGSMVNFDKHAYDFSTKLLWASLQCA